MGQMAFDKLKKYNERFTCLVEELQSYSDQILLFCGEDSSSFSCTS